jgi:hypothetical protein
MLRRYAKVYLLLGILIFFNINDKIIIGQYKPAIIWNNFENFENPSLINKYLNDINKMGFGEILIKPNIEIPYNCEKFLQNINYLFIQAEKADIIINLLLDYNHYNYLGPINDLFYIKADSLRPDTTIRYTIDSLKPEHSTYIKSYAFSPDFHNKVEIDWLIDKSNYTNYYQPASGWKVFFLYTKNFNKTLFEDKCNLSNTFNSNPFLSDNWIKLINNSQKNNAIYFNSTGLNGINICKEIIDLFKDTHKTDLNEFLYIFINEYDTDIRNRILTDYYETLNIYVAEILNKKLYSFCKSINKTLYVNSNNLYNSILDQYAYCDIPEAIESRYFQPFINDETLTNYSNIIHFSLSASNTQNKNITAVKINGFKDKEPTSIKVSDLKKITDFYFKEGINKIILNNALITQLNADKNYSTIHQTFAFSSLNSYIEKCQKYLQTSGSDNELLIYFPIYDIWNINPPSAMRDDSTFEWFNNSEFNKTINELKNYGYQYDYISDNQIQNITVKNKKIFSGNAIYEAIIIPKCNMLKLETIQKLMEIADNGGRIFFVSGLPKDVPGYYQYEINRLKLLDMKYALFVNQNIKVIQSIKELNNFNLIGEKISDYKLYFIRKNIDNKKIYFIANYTGENFNKEIQLKTKASAWEYYNPLNEKRSIILINDKNEVNLELKNGESCFLIQTSMPKDLKNANIYEYTHYIDKPSDIKTQWIVTFPDGNPKINDTIICKNLSDLNELKNDDLKKYNGKIKYYSTFILPQNIKKSNYYSLKIEDINELAEVFINDYNLGILWTQPYELLIPSEILTNKNVIEIYVFNTNKDQNYSNNQPIGINGNISIAPVNKLNQ